MTTYLLFKYLHILAAITMVGTTFCNGLLRVSADKTGSVTHIAAISKGVMVLNRYLMAPSFVLLIPTGLLTAHAMDMQLTTLWLIISMILTGILVIEFIWGYKIEENMEQAVAASVQQKLTKVDPRYWQLEKTGVWIGSSAALFSLIIIYLMVSRPL